MIPIRGHIALIIPTFAKANRYSPKGVGIYEYLGEEWKTLTLDRPSAVLLRWCEMKANDLSRIDKNS